MRSPRTSRPCPRSPSRTRAELAQRGRRNCRFKKVYPLATLSQRPLLAAMSSTESPACARMRIHASAAGGTFGRDAERMAELVGNKAIETAAIEWVMELERTAGRQPRDTRFAGAPADILSPPRVIEVKAFGKSNPRLRSLAGDPANGGGTQQPGLLPVCSRERPPRRSGLVYPPGTCRRSATAPSGARQGAALLHRPLARRPLRQLPAGLDS